LSQLFFIYDSRAVLALSILKKKLKTELKQQISQAKADHEYAKFAYKSLVVINDLKRLHHIDLTPRQFDNILMQIAGTKTNN